VTVRKKVLRAQNIGRRLRSLSAFGFGASWEYPPSERQAIRKLIVFLEDRRALFAPYDPGIAHHSIFSANRIREECTEVLKDLSESSPAATSLRAMRAACRRYMDDPRVGADWISHRSFEEQADFFTALGELRASIGAQVATLSALYDLEIEADLTSILPTEDEDE
jgi:hypothetical protein